MNKPLLMIENIYKSFGALQASNNICLDVVNGECHAIIGPNGAGKSTLIGQLAGELKPDEGRIMFADEDMIPLKAYQRVNRGLVRSFQITQIFKDFTALDNVSMAIQAVAGHSFKFWQNARKDKALILPATEVLERVGLGARANVMAGALAHGEQKSLELAMALALKPRMLLLDEPMAGMGPEETNAMVTLLNSLKDDVSMLLIEHDMDAVFALADRLSVLVYGQIIATGAPAEIRANAEVQAAYLGHEAADQSAANQSGSNQSGGDA